MITQSGIHIQKTGGAEGTPTSEDIAVHMGRICRFGGAIWYPLLTHSVFVGLLVYKRSFGVQNALWGFLHDAHEIATSDVPRPFKCDCMRGEQRAIDGRIFEQYLPTLRDESLINWDLIKQCDNDACDIEAVELGVPGYDVIEPACTGGRTLHSEPGDVELLRRILNGPFFTDTLDGMDSEGVRMFSRVLEAGRSGSTIKLMTVINSWGLLKEIPVASDRADVPVSETADAV